MIKKGLSLKGILHIRLRINRIVNLFFVMLICFGLNACESGEKGSKFIPPIVFENAVTPVLLEIIGVHDTIPSSKDLLDILAKNGQDTPKIFNWKNHWVAIVDSARANEIQIMAKALFPTAEVKLYPKPFYTFQQQNCDTPTIAAEWDYVFLTTNLVADTAKQQAYFNHHQTQFELWPEVAKGFCYAGFQRLLVYHNNRQLVLIINIPKGQSLDSLNPKTTENNPRVDDWNKLMQQYQEGLPGTEPGEVWVFLNPIKKEE